MKPQRLRDASSELHVLGTVQGLTSEADRVRAAFATTSFSAVALGLPPEGAAALLQFEGAPDISLAADMADHDLVYSMALGQFGAVALPPPDLLLAAREARERGLSVYGVDLAEEAYDETFTKTVSVWGFLKLGRVQRRLAKRPPKAKGAREFSLAWDAAMRKVKGLAQMEALRERTIAQNAAALARREGGSVLLVVELPREAGVLAALAELGFRM